MRAEVQQLLDDYESVLNREHFAETSQYFCFPVIITYNGRTVVVNNPETFARINQSMLEELIRHNYSRSKIEDVTVLASTEELVELEARFDLIDSEGQTIRSPSNILTIKCKDGQWFINSIVGTSSEDYDLDISS